MYVPDGAATDHRAVPVAAQVAGDRYGPVARQIAGDSGSGQNPGLATNGIRETHPCCEDCMPRISRPGRCAPQHHAQASRRLHNMLQSQDFIPAIR
jgi:hypothetical protein